MVCSPDHTAGSRQSDPYFCKAVLLWWVKNPKDQTLHVSCKVHELTYVEKKGCFSVCKMVRLVKKKIKMK